MTYDESDRVERNMHGIYFLANATETRRVISRVVASDEWRQWSWRDDLIKSHGAGHYHASTMESNRDKAGLHWICKEGAEWFQKLVALTLREVEAMEGDR